jgi:glycosyltransferase involved in cell wall biosynthesis
MDKLISVIIPTYNRKKLTDMAVASVVVVDPTQVEIVVVDDCGSTPYNFDGVNLSGVTVRVIRLDKNVGAGIARQAGLAHATGRFIAYLDSDDCYDPAWMDYVINMLQRVTSSFVFLSGITQGGREVAARTRSILMITPDLLKPFACRLIATIFNPFYTPSLVMSRDLCIFKDGLRHCEDYYSTAFALFYAKDIYIPPVVACHLGRSPNTAGGESSARAKMFRGEWAVRVAMLKHSRVPFGYKLFIPLGMVYQLLRTSIKSIVLLSSR